MRAVIQRVKESKITIGDKVIAKIGKGILVFLAIAKQDSIKDVEYLARKIADLRIFDDNESKMNLSLKDVGGQILVVSEFTLLGDCRKGRRPSFDEAAPGQEAKVLYERFIKKLDELGLEVRSGKFQAYMDIRIINDGPVTFILDSPAS